MVAASDTEPARVLSGLEEVPEPSVRLLDAILKIVRPVGVQLAGGPRLSQARLEPAEFRCWINGDLGRKIQGTTGPVALSAHERIVHAGAILSFLIENGMPEPRRTPWVDHRKHGASAD